MEATKQYMAFEAGETRYAVPMEYVGYIVAASEKYPQCMPPGMPVYVKCIMRMEQKPVPIVDLARLKDDIGINEQEHIYSLILVFSYEEKPVGVLADDIFVIPEQPEIKVGIESVTQRMIIKIDSEDFVLFNVPELYAEI